MEPGGEARQAAMQVRQLGDELRGMAEVGLSWSADNPHDRDRYEHARRIAAKLFALADERSALEIERTVFREITHVTPLVVGDAAVIDDEGKMLLIQRADDEMWAMPGGAFDVDETPAEGVCREALEETGYVVEPLGLVGIYDSQYCHTRSSLRLCMFVFLCKPLRRGQPSTPHEVLDVGWFAEDELPPLSLGHEVRIPDAFRYWRAPQPAVFDAIRPAH